MSPIFFNDTWAGAGKVLGTEQIVIVGPGFQRIAKLTAGRRILDMIDLSGDSFLILVENNDGTRSFIGPGAVELGIDESSGKSFYLVNKILEYYPQGMLLIEFVNNQKAWYGPRAREAGIEGDGFNSVSRPRFFSDGKQWVACISSYSLSPFMPQKRCAFRGTWVDSEIKKCWFREILNFDSATNKGEPIFVVDNNKWVSLVCVGESSTDKDWDVVGMRGIINQHGGLDIGALVYKEFFCITGNIKPYLMCDGTVVMQHDEWMSIKLPYDQGVLELELITEGLSYWKISQYTAQKAGIPSDTYDTKPDIDFMRITDSGVFFSQNGTWTEALPIKNNGNTEKRTDIHVTKIRVSLPVPGREQTFYKGTLYKNWLTRAVSLYRVGSLGALSHIQDNRWDVRWQHVADIGMTDPEIAAMQLSVYLIEMEQLLEEQQKNQSESSDHCFDFDVLSSVVRGNFNAIKNFSQQDLLRLLKILKNTSYDEEIKKIIEFTAESKEPYLNIEQVIPKLSFSSDEWKQIIFAQEGATGGPARIQFYENYIFKVPYFFKKEHADQIKKINNYFLDKCNNDKELGVMYKGQKKAVFERLQLIDKYNLPVEYGDKVLGYEHLKSACLALRYDSFFPPRYFDLEISPEQRNSFLYKLIQTLRRVPSCLKCDITVPFWSKSWKKEKRKFQRNLAEWDKTNREIPDVFGPNIQGNIKINLWKELGKELLYDLGGLLFIFGFCAFILSYIADDCRQIKSEMKFFGYRQIKRILNKAQWFDQRRKTEVKSFLERFFDDHKMFLTYEQESDLEILRNSLSDKEELLFDICLCIAIEPADIKDAISRIFRYLFFQGALISAFLRGQKAMKYKKKNKIQSFVSAFFSVFTPWNYWLRRNMNKELQELAEKLNSSEKVEDLRKELSFILDKYKAQEVLSFKQKILNTKRSSLNTEPADISKKSISFDEMKNKILKFLRNKKYLQVESINQYLLKHNGSSLRAILASGTKYLLTREYVWGDDVRRINWLKTAKFGKPMVNDTETDIAKESYLLIDMSTLFSAQGMNIDVWLEDIINSLRIMWDANNLKSRERYNLDSIIFLMPDASIKKISANIKAKEFASGKKGSISKFLIVFKDVYEEAKLLSSSAQLSFYGKEKNERYKQRTKDLLSYRSNAITNIQKIISSWKMKNRYIFCAGLDETIKDDIFRVFYKHKAFMYFWKKGTASVYAGRNTDPLFKKKAVNLLLEVKNEKVKQRNTQPAINDVENIKATIIGGLVLSLGAVPLSYLSCFLGRWSWVYIAYTILSILILGIQAGIASNIQERNETSRAATPETTLYRIEDDFGLILAPLVMAHEFVHILTKFIGIQKLGKIGRVLDEVLAYTAEYIIWPFAFSGWILFKATFLWDFYHNRRIGKKVKLCVKEIEKEFSRKLKDRNLKKFKLNVINCLVCFGSRAVPFLMTEISLQTNHDIQDYLIEAIGQISLNMLLRHKKRVKKEIVPYLIKCEKEKSYLSETIVASLGDIGKNLGKDIVVRETIIPFLTQKLIKDPKHPLTGKILHDLTKMYKQNEFSSKARKNIMDCWIELLDNSKLNDNDHRSACFLFFDIVKHLPLKYPQRNILQLFCTCRSDEIENRAILIKDVLVVTRAGNIKHEDVEYEIEYNILPKMGQTISISKIKSKTPVKIDFSEEIEEIMALGKETIPCLVSILNSNESLEEDIFCALYEALGRISAVSKGAETVKKEVVLLMLEHLPLVGEKGEYAILKGLYGIVSALGGDNICIDKILPVVMKCAKSMKSAKIIRLYGQILSNIAKNTYRDDETFYKNMILLWIELLDKDDFNEKSYNEIFEGFRSLVEVLPYDYPNRDLFFLLINRDNCQIVEKALSVKDILTIFENPEFLEQTKTTENIVEKYSIARAIDLNLKRFEQSITSGKVKKLIPFIKKIKQKRMNKKIWDKNTDILIASHEEEEFDPDIIFAFLDKYGADVKKIGGQQGSEAEYQDGTLKKELLDYMKTCSENTMIWFNVHGGREYLFLDKNRAIIKNNGKYVPYAIHYEELVDAFLGKTKKAEMAIEGKEVRRVLDVSKINVVLDCCFSADFMINFYNYMYNMCKIKNIQIKGMPAIVPLSGRQETGWGKNFIGKSKEHIKEGQAVTLADIDNIRKIIAITHEKSYKENSKGVFISQFPELLLPIHPEELQELKELLNADKTKFQDIDDYLKNPLKQGLELYPEINLMDAMGKYNEIKPVEITEQGILKGKIQHIEDKTIEVDFEKTKQEKIKTESINKYLEKIEALIGSEKHLEAEQELLKHILDAFKGNMPVNIILTEEGVNGFFGTGKTKGIAIDRNLLEASPLSFLHEIIEYVKHFEPDIIKQMKALLDYSPKNPFNGGVWFDEHEKKYREQNNLEFFEQNKTHYIIRAFTRQFFKANDEELTLRIKNEQKLQQAEIIIDPYPKNGPEGIWIDMKHYDVIDAKCSLATDLYTCLGLIIIDKVRKKHYLGHISPLVSIEHIKATLNDLDLENSEVYIVEEEKPYFQLKLDIVKALRGGGFFGKINYRKIKKDHFVVTFDGKLYSSLVEDIFAKFRKEKDSGSLNKNYGKIGKLKGAEDKGDEVSLFNAVSLYSLAKNIIPTIESLMRKAPTYVIEPAVSLENVSPVISYLRKTERTLTKKGHNVHARAYLMDKKWKDNLKKEIQKMLPLFYEDLSTYGGKLPMENITRMAIRIVSSDIESEKETKKEIRAFIEEKLKQYTDPKTAKYIADNKIKFIQACAQDAKHFNTVMDLFVDAAMVECERYGQKDGYPDQILERDNPDLANKFIALFESSIENFDDFKGNTATQIARKVFNGQGILMIKKIDWESIREWKDNQDKILSSL
ncbi:MAG: DUF58 domain-containing protein [Candidatus Omnitrophota bacterium]